mmetsp:Transcript_10193/g.35202  ORF Transcript_10193/g.35202 Transcript_10193/m.35202 type:complete len:93 (-) Transcript_10193:1117-1395(-)
MADVVLEAQLRTSTRLLVDESGILSPRIAVFAVRSLSPIHMDPAIVVVTYYSRERNDSESDHAIVKDENNHRARAPHRSIYLFFLAAGRSMS